VNSAIRGAVFDFDGLTVDSERVVRHAFRESAVSFGHTLSDEFFASLVGGSHESTSASLLDSFGADFDLVVFREHVSRHFQAHVAEHGMGVRPGAVAMLDLLDNRGVPIALATSSPREYVERTLEHTGLAGRFSVLVCRDEVDQPKPAPDIYLKACGLIDIEPALCVAFEDSNTGHLAACRAGLQAVLVPNTASI